MLELIAEGRSNGEIGDRLFISSRTVSVHVSHLLAKLGAASRTEASRSAGAWECSRTDRLLARRPRPGGAGWTAVTARFRCSVAASAEPMAGSAAQDRAFLCIEHPGPWGRKAVPESRWLPEHVRDELAARDDLRVQLVRRHGRGVPDSGFRVFLAYADPVAPWTETTRLADQEQLLELDLDAFGAGRRTGLALHDDPLVLVCTNGRRDACCAELGRPLAAGLAAAHPDLVWETTHVGGHRFAGAMLVLPAGLSYGRVDVAAGLRIAELSRAGRLDPALLRGRSSYPPAAQAAEVELLTRLGEDRVDALELVSHHVDGPVTTVTFRAGAGTQTVEVESVAGAPLRQSCADEVAKPTTHFVVRPTIER